MFDNMKFTPPLLKEESYQEASFEQNDFGIVLWTPYR